MLGIKEIGLGGIILIAGLILMFGKTWLIKIIKEWKGIKTDIDKALKDEPQKQ